MSQQIHTVAVYPPGDSFNRVLIPGLLMDAEVAPAEAVIYAARAIAALSAIPCEQWHATVVSTTEVEDIPIQPQP